MSLYFLFPYKFLIYIFIEYSKSDSDNFLHFSDPSTSNLSRIAPK